MGTQVFLGNPPPSIVAWIKAERDRKGPLFFEANEPNVQVRMLAMQEDTSTPAELRCNMEYSDDGMKTWKRYGGSNVTLANIGDRVYFRAPEGQPNTNGLYDKATQIGHHFDLTGSAKCGGNIQFLLESTGSRTDAPAYAYSGLFGLAIPGETAEDWKFCCATMTTAPVLPATTLADHCYNGMFGRCTSLASAPALPAMALAERCYDSMFLGCSSLTTAPALPATALAERCYSKMFYGCSSLTSAPALPATVLVDSCYSGMFRECTSLSSMEVAFADWNPTSNATNGWLRKVAATGTFTCPAELPEPDIRGADNIPDGWTRADK